MARWQSLSGTRVVSTSYNSPGTVFCTMSESSQKPQENVKYSSPIAIITEHRQCRSFCRVQFTNSFLFSGTPAGSLKRACASVVTAVFQIGACKNEFKISSSTWTDFPKCTVSTETDDRLWLNPSHVKSLPDSVFLILPLTPELLALYWFSERSDGYVTTFIQLLELEGKPTNTKQELFLGHFEHLKHFGLI